MERSMGFVEHYQLVEKPQRVPRVACPPVNCCGFRTGGQATSGTSNSFSTGSYQLVGTGTCSGGTPVPRGFEHMDRLFLAESSCQLRRPRFKNRGHPMQPGLLSLIILIILAA